MCRISEDEFDSREDSNAGVWDDPQAMFWRKGEGFDPWSAGPRTGWRQCELPYVRGAAGLRFRLRARGVSWPFSTPRRGPCAAACRELVGDGS